MHEYYSVKLHVNCNNSTIKILSFFFLIIYLLGTEQMHAKHFK